MCFTVEVLLKSKIHFIELLFVVSMEHSLLLAVHTQNVEPPVVLLIPRCFDDTSMNLFCSHRSAYSNLFFLAFKQFRAYIHKQRSIFQQNCNVFGVSSVRSHSVLLYQGDDIAFLEFYMFDPLALLDVVEGNKRPVGDE